MNDLPPTSTGAATARANDSSRLQGVSLEVPVTLQGLPGPGGGQAFYEETRTVLVMAHGAVVRLATEVLPGQKLVLTNPRTKQEVLARVVHSRSHLNTKGYVEVEFTQPAPGFWGMSFPSEMPARVAAQPSATPIPARQPAKQAAPPESKAKLFVVPQANQSPTAQGHAPAQASVTRLTYERDSVPPEVVPLADVVKKRPANVTPATSTPVVQTPVAPATVPQKPAASFGPKTTTEVVTVRMPQLGESERTGELRSRARAWIYISFAAVVLAGSAGFFLYNSSSSAKAERVTSESAVQSATPTATEASETVTPSAAVPPAEAIAPSASSVAPTSAPPSPAPAETPVGAQRNTAIAPNSGSAPVEKTLSASARPERRSPPKVTLAAPVLDTSRVASAASEPPPNVVPEPAAVPPVTVPALPMAFSNAGAPPAPQAPRVSGRAQPAKLISSPPPTYPPIARAQRLQGEVVLEASIDANGNVTEVSVTSGHAMLQQAAIDAVKRWRYEPARLNNQPIPTRTQVRVFFRP